MTKLHRSALFILLLAATPGQAASPSLLGKVQTFLTQTPAGRGASQKNTFLAAFSQLNPRSQTHLRLFDALGMPNNFESAIQEALERQDPEQLETIAQDLLNSLNDPQTEQNIHKALFSGEMTDTDLFNRSRRPFKPLSALVSASGS